MRFSSSWLRHSTRSAPVARPRIRTSPRERAAFRPLLEALEDRCLFSTLTVTSLQDSGAGSLRATINAAASGDTIVFSSSLFSSATATSSPLVSSSSKGNGSGKGNGKGRGKPVSPPTTPNTITLTSGPLALAKNLTIEGPSTTPLTITSTEIYASTIFGVGVNTTVTLSDITISKGFSSGSAGGIYNAGALTLDGCTVSGCAALYYGGGIYNVGTLSISNSTLSGNSARFGGAIYNAGMVTIDSSTVSGNHAFQSDYPWSGGYGGGIFNDANGTITVRNSSSITGNTNDWYAGGVGPDVYNLGTIYHDGTSTIGGLYGNAAVLI
jgi:hypothetical protein